MQHKTVRMSKNQPGASEDGNNWKVTRMGNISVLGDGFLEHGWAMYEEEFKYLESLGRKTEGSQGSVCTQWDWFTART